MENLVITEKDKGAVYDQIIPQIESVTSCEPDLIANMANVSAVLKEAFHFWWVGFYLVKENASGEKELVLGPFQGPLACTRIKKGRGVCGTAWKDAAAIVVPDVDAFPGHIACSSLSRSEIVVPVMGKDGEVAAVLDIDSEKLGTFDNVDREKLELLLSKIKFAF